MNERLTIQDLTDLLASKHSMTKKDAEAFVKEFFLLIEEALENEKYVKIKGLGTFKLIEVDNRESVNVNTGERFQIKGHTKVSFTPDTNLRDIINKPFAHFETVVLNDNTILEDTPEEDVDGEEEEVTEEVSVQNTLVVEEVKAEQKAVEEVPAETSVSVQDVPLLREVEPVVEKNIDIQNEMLPDEETDLVKDEPVSVVEEPVEEVEMPAIEGRQPLSVVSEKHEEVISAFKEVVLTERVKEQASTPVAEQPQQPQPVSKSVDSKIEFTAEQIIAQELQKANLKPEVPKNQLEVNVPVVTSNDTLAPVTAEKETAPPKEKSPIPYLITIIILVLLLCGSAIVFIYYPDLFSSSPNKSALDMPVVTQPVQSTVQQPTDTIVAKDTVAKSAPVADQSTSLQATPAVKEEVANPAVPVKKESKERQPQVSASVYSDSAVYTITGTKGTHIISAGESLTKVSLRYYGTKALWPYIVKHNQGVIKNPDNVPYGTTIKIPELTKK